MLYQWGPVQFKVFPLNLHEIDHETATDWAKKEIVGAAIYREWVGENDETLYIRGRIFPYRIGGMSALEAFEAMRRGGIANMMIRGDGAVLGWFVCEKLVRNHTSLSSQGVGQMIAFEAVLTRVPVPENDQYASQLWGSVLNR
jgi:phage protein U